MRETRIFVESEFPGWRMLLGMADFQYNPEITAGKTMSGYI